MKNIFLSSILITLLSTTAMATGTIIIAANNAHPAVSTGPIVTAAEGLKLTAEAIDGFDLDLAVHSPLGNAIGRAIAYTPSIVLNDNDMFTVTLTGATFKDTSMHLIVDEANAGGNGVAIDINADGDTNDVVEVAEEINRVNGNPMMRVILSDGLTANTHMMLVENTTNVGALMDETENPVVTIDARATSVTVAITDAKTACGVSLAVANTAPTPLFLVRNQITVTFGQGTSTIDVNNDRLQFLPKNNTLIEESSNDTELFRSAGTITFTNNIPTPPTIIPIDDFIHDDQLNQLTLTLTDTAGFESISTSIFDNNTPAWNEQINGTDTLFTINTTNATAQLLTANIPTVGTGATEDIILTVGGTNGEPMIPLKTRTLGLTAALDFTNPLLTDVLKDESSFITWNINGYQASVQDVKLSSTYNTGLTIYNKDSSATGKIKITAIDALSGLNLGTAQFKNILPNSRQAIAASSIEKLIPDAVGKTYRVDLITTIPTASGDCDAWQLFKGASLRTLPVRDNNPKNSANNNYKQGV